jgi:pimeloyl-ACP methyl ester carboxylesterase
MQARAKLALALSSLLLAACSSSSNAPRATPAPPASNDSGSTATAIITARFDPATSVLPFPINLLLSGTTDLTLNPPVANPNNLADPAVALSALDGFSTVAPWSFSLSATPNPQTLRAGASIRIFEVVLTGPGGAVTRVVRELTTPAEYVVTQAPSDPTGRTVVVLPTSPLKPLTSYMAVVTDDVRDAAGNDATPDTTYFLTKRTSPLCANGQSTDPLIPTANACALEPLRQLTNAQEIAAAGAGIPREDIVLSWVATTQSTATVLQAIQSRTTRSSATVAPTGLNLSAAGLPPVADIFIGVLGVPYYLQAPAAATPQAQAIVLQTTWRAAPGAYVPPFNALGLSPASTNVTFANPFPVSQSTQNVPLIMTIPNANSGRQRPAAGWPVIIFMHGITGNRTQALGLAAQMAASGFAVVAIDQPLHGVTDTTSPFYIERTPFGPIASERTFDVDLLNNAAPCPAGQAICPDGRIDSSGAHFINLGSLLTSRDNLRQSVVDLMTLAKTIPSVSIDGDAIGDFDGSRITFVGQSLGAIVGTAFMATETSVTTGVLNVPGGGIARLLEASPAFGPQIRAGLAAGAGLQPNTPNYDQFFLIAQTVLDSVDPINFGSVGQNKRILMQLVVGNGSTIPADQVVPISVATAPLSGGEPLARVLGLSTITQTTTNSAGIRGITRFTAGDHGTLLSPVASLPATQEMQLQAATMAASAGTNVTVGNAAVIRTQ